MSEAMPQHVNTKRRRADILRLKFRGKGHYYCTLRRWPRWTIDDMAFLLGSLAKDYDQEQVGCPKRRFTKQEVANLVFWVLYKQRPPWPDNKLIARMTLKQAKFLEYLFSPIALGNATKAARLAGYRHPKQRGYELWKRLRSS